MFFLFIAFLIFSGALCNANAQALDSRSQFEVASVKPNPGCETRVASQQPAHPGRLAFACMNVEAMIRYAYGFYANGASRDSAQLRLAGLPDWAQSDRFLVDARAQEGTRFEMMAGPMLRALLEDRFHLKTHLEYKDVEAYGIAVGKNGPKMHPATDESCTPLDPNNYPETSAGKPKPHLCGDRSTVRLPEGGYSFEFYGNTLKELSMFLATSLDRPVIDDTSLAGRFDFHLTFSPGGDTDAFPGPFAAVEEQLGLKLIPKRAKVKVLVIEALERPTPN